MHPRIRARGPWGRPRGSGGPRGGPRGRPKAPPPPGGRRGAGLGPGQVHVPGVGPAFHGGLGADEAHLPEAAGGPGGGLHHPEDRHGEVLGEVGQGGGTRRVAGHHDGLHPLPQEKARDLPGEAAHHGEGLAAVGHAGRVPEVEKLLPGQEAAEGLEHRKPPHPGVKDADGSLGVLHGAPSYLSGRKGGGAILSGLPRRGHRGKGGARVEAGHV